jgi:hypothetical protein
MKSSAPSSKAANTVFYNPTAESIKTGIFSCGSILTFQTISNPEIQGIIISESIKFGFSETILYKAPYPLAYKIT